MTAFRYFRIIKQLDGIIIRFSSTYFITPAVKAVDHRSGFRAHKWHSIHRFNKRTICCMVEIINRTFNLAASWELNRRLHDISFSVDPIFRSVQFEFDVSTYEQKDDISFAMCAWFVVWCFFYGHPTIVWAIQIICLLTYIRIASLDLGQPCNWHMKCYHISHSIMWYTFLNTQLLVITY